MPRKLIVANWKMNGTTLNAHSLAKTLIHKTFSNAVVVLCPSFCYLSQVGAIIKDTPHFALGAQNCHSMPKGAYTGEISAPMLKDLGASYVILGHSERRQHFGETNEQVRAKVTATQDNGLIPIVCIGETLEERNSGQTLAIITKQLAESLPQDFNGVIAYEPIWAIGTGLIPSLEEITTVHNTLKDYTVLYGGSVNGSNAHEILNLETVAGVLVGGASLDADQFTTIAESA